MSSRWISLCPILSTRASKSLSFLGLICSEARRCYLEMSKVCSIWYKSVCSLAARMSSCTRRLFFGINGRLLLFLFFWLFFIFKSSTLISTISYFRYFIFYRAFSRFYAHVFYNCPYSFIWCTFSRIIDYLDERSKLETIFSLLVLFF